MRERSVYSINQRRRLEDETTHEREERLQQLSDNHQTLRLPLFTHARPIMHSILLVLYGTLLMNHFFLLLNFPRALRGTRKSTYRRTRKGLVASHLTRYNWGERERVPPWEFNAPPVCLSVCLSVCLYISYVRHFWSRGPRATRKRKPAHLKFKGHMHACCIRKYGSTFYIGIAMVVLPYFGLWEN